MFKLKYVDSIMMLVRLDLNLIVSLFQHKCEVSETVSTTTLPLERHYDTHRLVCKKRNQDDLCSSQLRVESCRLIMQNTVHHNRPLSMCTHLVFLQYKSV